MTYSARSDDGLQCGDEPLSVTTIMTIIGPFPGIPFGVKVPAVALAAAGDFDQGSVAAPRTPNTRDAESRATRPTLCSRAELILLADQRIRGYLQRRMTLVTQPAMPLPGSPKWPAGPGSNWPAWRPRPVTRKQLRRSTGRARWS